MKTQWDYTELAQAYLKRCDYAPDAISALIEASGVVPGDPVCDVGAGVAHLTLPLARAGLSVTAVEPNDAMRKLGRLRTSDLVNVRWFEGTGEQTGQPDDAFELVTFGSSFNVTDRQTALRETYRILRSGGWFAAMWNHRDLNDPVQAKIESIIHGMVPAYSYGSRREDQTDEIARSGLFEPAIGVEGRVLHQQSVQDIVEAWRSHATLARQAGDAFPRVIEAIEAFLAQTGAPAIDVPYDTRIWMAKALRG